MAVESEVRLCLRKDTPSSYMQLPVDQVETRDELSDLRMQPINHRYGREFTPERPIFKMRKQMMKLIAACMRTGCSTWSRVFISRK